MCTYKKRLERVMRPEIVSVPKLARERMARRRCQERNVMTSTASVERSVTQKRTLARAQTLSMARQARSAGSRALQDFANQVRRKHGQASRKEQGVGNLCIRMLQV